MRVGLIAICFRPRLHVIEASCNFGIHEAHCEGGCPKLQPRLNSEISARAPVFAPAKRSAVAAPFIAPTLVLLAAFTYWPISKRYGTRSISVDRAGQFDGGPR